jgi:hypothetical protein
MEGRANQHAESPNWQTGNCGKGGQYREGKRKGKALRLNGNFSQYTEEVLIKSRLNYMLTIQKY